MNQVLDFIKGAAYAALFVCACIGLLASAGCANGVVMNEEETKSCRDAGCTAWTNAELQELANRVGRDAYRKGWLDALRQRGRDL